MERRFNSGQRDLESSSGRLSTKARREGGEIAASVFSEDGLFRLLFPTDALRPKGVELLHRGLLAAIPRSTLTTKVTRGGRLLGCSLWVPPGAWPYPRTFYRRTGRQSARLVATADLDAQSAETLLATVNAAHPPAPHWYLQLLMVDARAQRRGIGTELLQPGLAAADREGVICVLETQARRNLAFYHRAGFVVTAESSDESGTATMWTMVRQPR